MAETPAKSSSKPHYEDLRKRLGLPDLRIWVDVEDECTASDIRALLQEKLLSIVDLTASLVNPEGYDAALEAQVFSEVEHAKIQAYHRRVMLLIKDCQLAELESSNTEEEALLKRLVQELPTIIVEAKSIVERTKRAYIDNSSHYNDTSYLG